MVGINPGQLIDPIEVCELNRVSDGAGGYELIGDEPTIRFTTHARVLQKRSLKGNAEGRMVVNQFYTITLRYANGRMPQIDNIIKYKGKRLIITSILEKDERNLLIDLIAVAER